MPVLRVHAGPCRLMRKHFDTAIDALYSPGGVLDQKGSDPAEEDVMVWLDVASATQADVSALATAFDLHPLTIRDCLSGSIADKCEVFPNYVVVGMTIDPGTSFLAILCRRILLTFRPQFCDVCDQFLRVVDEEMAKQVTEGSEAGPSPPTNSNNENAPSSSSPPPLLAPPPSASSACSAGWRKGQTVVSGSEGAKGGGGAGAEHHHHHHHHAKTTGPLPPSPSRFAKRVDTKSGEVIEMLTLPKRLVPRMSWDGGYLPETETALAAAFETASPDDQNNNNNNNNNNVDNNHPHGRSFEVGHNHHYHHQVPIVPTVSGSANSSFSTVPSTTPSTAFTPMAFPYPQSQQQQQQQQFPTPPPLSPVVSIVGSPSLVQQQQQPSAPSLSSPSGAASRVLFVPTAPWILTRLVEEMVHRLDPQVEAIVAEVDTLTDLVFVLGVKDSNELLVRIGRATRTLSQMKMHLRPKKISLERMVKKEPEWEGHGAVATAAAAVMRRAASRDLQQQQQQQSGLVDGRPVLLYAGGGGGGGEGEVFGKGGGDHVGEEVRLYLSSGRDRIVRMLDRIESATDVLTNIQNNYLGQISLEMSGSSHRLSLMMQQLNVVATVMLPLSVVVGLFGMNVTIPGQTTGADGDMTWFFVILGGMVLFCIVSWKLFHRLGFTRPD